MEEGVNMAQTIAELRQLSVEALVARYEAVFGKPPRIKHREFLWKRVCWKLQEQAFGGLSTAAKNRLEELIAEIHLPPIEDRRSVSGRPRKPPPPRDQRAVGTTLVREWRGQQVQVRVTEAGFEWNGVVYKSLTAAAQAITGSHWNGKLFFGLTARTKKR